MLRTWNTATDMMKLIKHFGEGRLKDAGAIQKDLQLHDINIASYYTDKYAFGLDFRTIYDNTLHGSGRRLLKTDKEFDYRLRKKLNQQVNCLAICIYSRTPKLVFQMLSF